ncbi:hypothetical protein [Segetibacter koreensis]|uniref:hypothetical protein n=1 Tax=Segetibacter koreensis TaxID=398037 RepID=UPI00036F70EB|nr:hypothetical protein [Segetibacter koreensis]
MIKYWFLIIPVFLFACSAAEQKSALVVKTVLPKELKEISGITASDSDIWAITDKPHATIYRLDLSGKLKEQVEITNAEATDVEAVASDPNYIYIADVGDNAGDRTERKIIKVAKANIKQGSAAKVTGEIIEFTFTNEEEVEKKKQNNFDCESLLSYKDSLYVFTKDREDKETRLYVLPKAAGKYNARFINSFNSKGLITDAAINPANNEVALIGYHKGHKFPFILLFNKFTGNDFFSGSHKKINLADKPWDWQLEGITYGNDNMLYFSCEGTKQVAATFYGIKREDLHKIEKKKESNSQPEDNGEPELTKKGHLKM